MQQPHEGPAAAIANPKVVMVDDSATARNVVRPALLNVGCEVVSLLGPAGALSVILRESPDVVLLDVAVPGLRVRHLIDGIRHARLARTPKILLFGHGAQAVQQELVRRSGADGYIDKAREPSAIAEQVHELANCAGLQRGVPAALGSLHGLPKVLLVARDRNFLDNAPEAVLPEAIASAEYVSSGCEALRRVLSSNPPDLVIADTQTTDVPGISLYHALAASDGSWRQRFVLVVDPKHFDQGLTSFLLQVEVAVLQRPIDAGDVAQLIRLLNSAPRPKGLRTD